VDGVLLAYGAAQVISALPIVPGGLGIVEGSLAVILAVYGVARVPATPVALACGRVSFWLSITVGWISAGGLALAARRTGWATARSLTGNSPQRRRGRAATRRPRCCHASATGRCQAGADGPPGLAASGRSPPGRAAAHLHRFRREMPWNREPRLSTWTWKTSAR